jgi:hypothetical protein
LIQGPTKASVRRTRHGACNIALGKERFTGVEIFVDSGGGVAQFIGVEQGTTVPHIRIEAAGIRSVSGWGRRRVGIPIERVPPPSLAKTVELGSGHLSKESRGLGETSWRCDGGWIQNILDGRLACFRRRRRMGRAEMDWD